MNEKLCNKLKSQLERKKAKLQLSLTEHYLHLTGAEEGVSLTDSASCTDALQFLRIALELSARKQRQLLLVQSALKAISRGTYGNCRKCGSAISETRLEIQPETLFCIGCAAKPQTMPEMRRKPQNRKDQSVSATFIQ